MDLIEQGDVLIGRINDTEQELLQITRSSMLGSSMPTNLAVTMIQEGMRQLRILIQKEMSGLQRRIELDGELTQHVRASCNLRAYEVLFNEIVKEKSNGVVRIGAKFLWRDDQSIKVDIVSQHGSKWIKVSCANPSGILMSFKGMGRPGEKSIIVSAQHFMLAAKRNPTFQQITPTVEFRFTQGIYQCVSNALSQVGIVVVGTILEDSTAPSFGDDEEEGNGDEEEEEKEDNNNNRDNSNPLESNCINESKDCILQNGQPINECIVNLDVSTIVYLCSETTNVQDVHEYHVRNNEPSFLADQLEKEKQNRSLEKVLLFLEGKEWIACESAVQSARRILNKIGGPKEKQRGQTIIKRIRIVPDAVGPHASKLQVKRKLSQISKLTFGTGEYYGAITSTSNEGFLRIAIAQKIYFKTWVHPARALSEDYLEK